MLLLSFSFLLLLFVFFVEWVACFSDISSLSINKRAHLAILELKRELSSRRNTNLAANIRLFVLTTKKQWRGIFETDIKRHFTFDFPNLYISRVFARKSLH